MTGLDYALLGVLVVSVAWGVWRGLAREVVSLAGWVMAFLAANLLAGPLGEKLPESLGSSEFRVLIAFVGIFVLTLAVTTLLGLLLSRILKKVGLAGLDRVLGALFGLARGLVIIVAFGLLAGLSSLPQKELWTQSVIGPVLERTVLQLKPWLPPALSERLRYH